MAEESIRPDLGKCLAFIKSVQMMVQPDCCENDRMEFIEYGTAIYQNAIERLHIDRRIEKAFKEILHNQIFNIAIQYDEYGVRLKEHSENSALDYHLAALKIFRKLELDGLHTAICYDNIASCYNNLKEHKLALCYALNANSIFSNMITYDFSDLKLSNHIVGETYAFLENYEKQKEYYQKNIEIDLKYLPMNHPVLAHDYIAMSFVYRNLQNTEEQVNYLLKAYTILEKIYKKNFKNRFSYHKNNCLFDWINLLQGLIIAYDKLGNKEKVYFFISKIQEQRLSRILSEYNVKLVKKDEYGMEYELTVN